MVNSRAAVGLVILLGAALIGAGRFLLQIEKSQRVYLSAAGITVLYIAAYSSHASPQPAAPQPATSKESRP